MIKAVRTDNVTEFSRTLGILDGQGVDIYTSTAYIPESNVMAERTHSVLINLVISCLLAAHIPHGLWYHVLRHVVDARIAVVHSKAKKVRVESDFGHSPPYV